jgi:hypothetical protein
MHVSRESKIVAGITLIIIPTIIYGGTTLLSLVAGYGTGKGLTLDPTQIPLWRAGHGHAGVLVILTLILQPLVDATRLSATAKWIARLSVAVSSLAVSGGFFGLSYLPGMRFLLFFGVVSLAVGVVLTGIGLLRNL